MANVPPQNFPNTIPSSQLPPGYNPPQNHIGKHATPPPNQYGIKPDYNSSPHGTGTPVSMFNNFGQHSSNSSPAFNKPVMPATSVMNSQSSPHRPPLQQPVAKVPQNIMSPGYVPPASNIRPPVSNPGVPTSSFNQYPPGSFGIRPSNQMQPPVIPQQPWTSNTVNTSLPSSQAPLSYSSMQQPTVNGPPGPITSMGPTPSIGPPSGVRSNVAPPTSQYGPPLSYSSARQPMSSMNNVQPESTFPGSRTSQSLGPPAGSTFPGTRISQSLGPPPGSSNGPPLTAQSISGSHQGIDQRTRPQTGLNSGTPSGPNIGPPSGPLSGLVNTGSSMAPPLGPPSGLSQGFPSGPLPVMQSGLQQELHGPQQQGLQRGSQGLSSGPLGPPSGPLRPPSGPLGPPSGPLGTPSAPLGPPSGLSRPPGGPPGLQSGPISSQPSGQPLVPPTGPPMYPPPSQSSMNSRYPQNVPQQPNYNHQVPQGHNLQGYQNYNGPQSLTNQMSQLSVAQTGFNQLWGQQMFDLLQTRHILPEYPEDPPEIRLNHQFAESTNCSPEIFRCTVNRIPETNSLLQKSRLPLGILIHPFKDLNHLPVIQCTTIVRCRACRTYINPFVYFVDSKRWKCNLCYRVNDLPEEFQYDPVSKSYGDPTRRPEIKSATIEFIAPAEYMLRPPQPAIYLFLLDVSHIGRESEYLKVFSETLKSCLDQLPGDGRTQVGFICYDSHVHFYLMGEGLTRPREMTVLDIDDVFLPSPEALLVNLGERREMIQDLLDVLPKRHCVPGVPSSALGAALQAAFKLMSATGGRVTVLQTCLPNVGPGALTSREDPNARSSKEVAHLNPATDFYKRLALECSGAQIAVDLFLISSQYSDLATLSGISKFSGGSVYYMPVFSTRRAWQADQFKRMLTRYLTRKIGFEAVMRVRCTRGIGIHTFHGNFFVRSTDLLSLPNVSPDAGFGMQLTIDESLSDLQQVCFQAALLYTSSKGERRIRVHTLCLPVANNLTDILHSADQQCIVGLLTKMAVDRAQQSSLSDAREALSNVAVDTLCAHRLAQNLPSGAASGTLHAPFCLRLLPLYLSAILKHIAFRVGVSTRLDDRVAAMCNMKSLPLPLLLRSVYPDLYPVHSLHEHMAQPQGEEEEDAYPDPPRLHLTAERINSNGAYLLDDGEQIILYIGNAVSPAFISDTLGVPSYADIADEMRELPVLETAGNALLHSFVEKLNEERPYSANVIVLRDNSPARRLFLDRLVDDRMESAFSYYEFLQHVKSLMK